MFCGRRLDPPLTDGGLRDGRSFAECYRDRRMGGDLLEPAAARGDDGAPLADARGLPVSRRATDSPRSTTARGTGRARRKWTATYHDRVRAVDADPAWNPPTDGETAVALAQRVTRVLEAIAPRIPRRQRAGRRRTRRRSACAICALLGVDVGRFRYRFGCPVGSVIDHRVRRARSVRRRGRRPIAPVRRAARTGGHLTGQRRTNRHMTRYAVTHDPRSSRTPA